MTNAVLPNYSNVRILSLYWNNVDPRLVNAQRQVFNKLGFHIEQQNRHNVDHAIWMMEIFDNALDDDVIIIVDIDCIPLNSAAVQKAIASARNGRIYGCTQSANHIDHHYIYVAPMFLALTGKTWRGIGCPSLIADTEFDVAGRITLAGKNANYPIDFVYPTISAVPKWLLGDSHVYGLFTIYNNDYLHLFESRNKFLIECFIDLSDEIIRAGGNIDYRKYVVKASEESHSTYLKNYLDKKNILKKIKREWSRFKKRRLIKHP
ncbi:MULTISPECIES: hypothetical protein [Pectobacterium]|uniref:hypothetical protein n=1 Tax=Pectobacterium TaxID=122277 RepID=UPI000C7ECF5D|nr:MULTISPECIES: hypothetical protein [Pectobacterium]PLY38518.1 hypothetical protein F164LOC_04930 [Pectobacterium carotovorum]RRO00365.1 hypothetical protein DMB79_000765 [Pectobacterium aquaticum]